MKKQAIWMIGIAGAVNPPVMNEGAEYTVKMRNGEVLTVPYGRVPNLIPIQRDGMPPLMAVFEQEENAEP